METFRDQVKRLIPSAELPTRPVGSLVHWPVPRIEHNGSPVLTASDSASVAIYTVSRTQQRLFVLNTATESVVQGSLTLDRSPAVGMWQAPSGDSIIVCSLSGIVYAALHDGKTLVSTQIDALAGVTVQSVGVISPPIYTTTPEGERRVRRSSVYYVHGTDSTGATRAARVAIFARPSADLAVGGVAAGPVAGLEGAAVKAVAMTSGEMVVTTRVATSSGFALHNYYIQAMGPEFERPAAKTAPATTAVELDSSNDTTIGGRGMPVALTAPATAADSASGASASARATISLLSDVTGARPALATGVLETAGGQMIYRGPNGGLFTVDSTGKHVYRTKELLSVLERAGFAQESATVPPPSSPGGVSPAPRQPSAAYLQTNVYDSDGRMIFAGPRGCLFTLTPSGARAYSPAYPARVEAAKSGAALDLVLDTLPARIDPRSVPLGIENTNTKEMIYLLPDGHLGTQSGNDVADDLMAFVKRGAAATEAKAPTATGLSPAYILPCGSAIAFGIDATAVIIPYSVLEQLALAQQVRIPVRTGITDAIGRAVFAAVGARSDGDGMVVDVPEMRAQMQAESSGRLVPVGSIADLARNADPIDISDVNVNYRIVLYPNRIELIATLINEVVETYTADNVSGAGSGAGLAFNSICVDKVYDRLAIIGKAGFWDYAPTNTNRDIWLFHLLRRDYAAALSAASTPKAADTVRRCTASALFREGQLVRAAEIWAITSASPEHIIARFTAELPGSVLTLPGGAAGRQSRIETGLALRLETGQDSPIWYDQRTGQFTVRGAGSEILTQGAENSSDSADEALSSVADAVTGISQFVSAPSDEIFTGISDRGDGVYVIVGDSVVSRPRQAGSASHGTPISLPLYTTHGLRLMQSVATPGAYFCVDPITGSVVPLPNDLRTTAVAASDALDSHARAQQLAAADAAVGLGGALRPTHDNAAELALTAYLRRRLQITPESYTADRSVLATLLLDTLMRQAASARPPSPQHETVMRSIRSLLTDYVKVLPRRRVAALLDTVGNDELLLHWAKESGDWQNVLHLELGACNYLGAIEAIVALRQPAIWYQLGPTLMRHEPTRFVDCVLTTLPPPMQLDPIKLLPAIAAYKYSPSHVVNQAVRFLRACVNGRADWHINCHSETVYNYLLHFTAEHAQTTGDRAPLLDFIFTDTHYDPRYALRVCAQRGVQEAIVHLLGRIGLHSEAVDLSLELDDVSVPISQSPHIADALNNAAAPLDILSQRRLSARVVSHVIVRRKKLSDAMALVSNSNGRLSLADILPKFPQFNKIGEYRDAIAYALGDCAADIDSARSEIAITTSTASLLSQQQETMKQTFILSQPARRGFAISSASDDLFDTRRTGLICPICDASTATTAVDTCVFPCGHSYHMSCLRHHASTCTDGMYRNQVAAAETRLAAATSRHERMAAETELYDLLSSECPLCSATYAESLTLPLLPALDDAPKMAAEFKMPKPM